VLLSYLYVPGDRPDLMAKAVAGDADAVILDLEDGVAPSARVEAGARVAEMLTRWGRGSAEPGPRVPIAVRVHPDHLDEHLQMAVRGAAMVYLPKADMDSVIRCADLLDEIEQCMGLDEQMPLVALVESAQGLLDAARVARHERVDGLALGEADLCAELGIDPSADDVVRQALRLPLVIASAAAGRRGPTGPASTDYTDLEEYRRSCRELRRLGFVARSAVHPAQVPIINEEFSPDPAAIAHARELVTTFDAATAAGHGVIVGADGRMIDAAVVRSARRLVE